MKLQKNKKINNKRRRLRSFDLTCLASLILDIHKKRKKKEGKEKQKEIGEPCTDL